MESEDGLEVKGGLIHTLHVNGDECTWRLARQLDRVEPDEIMPVGRIRDPRVDVNSVEGRGTQVIGRHLVSGALVTSWASDSNKDAMPWLALPLIVLAGI